MTLPSKNQPCPCGSGKLYKRCHGAPGSPDPFLGVSDSVVAYSDDRQSGELTIHESDLVWKRLTTELPLLSASFDARYRADVEEISFELSIANALIALGLENAKGTTAPELVTRLGNILRNSFSSVVAALELTRAGYGLQPGILLRSVIEAVSVVFDVTVNQKSNQEFRAGRYSPTGAAGRASRVFRFLGRFFGVLSEHHTHIKNGHEVEHPMDSTGATASANLSLVKVGTALVSLATEFLFERSVAQARYWKRHADGTLSFSPDAEVRSMLKDFPTLKSEDSKL